MHIHASSHTVYTFRQTQKREGISIYVNIYVCFVVVVFFFVQFLCHLLWWLLILKGFYLCLVLFSALFFVFVISKKSKRLGFIFLFSFLHFLPQYTGSCSDCSHMRFVTLSLFCSSLLLFSSFAPCLLSWVAVLGHGGAVADFCMRGLSNFYSDSKKRIRTSYQSKSCLQ